MCEGNGLFSLALKYLLHHSEKQCNLRHLITQCFQLRILSRMK